MTGATPPYVIAEIGVNHDGDVKRASHMIDAAAVCGFDAVKFQYWNLDELLAVEAPNAPYQGNGDQHDLLASLRLDLDQLRVLKDRSHRQGVDFIVTPDGPRACVELLELGVDRLKIGSGDADNPWLLDIVSDASVPTIASTGMMTDDEVRGLIDRLDRVADLTLLHCVSAYPTPLEELSLPRLTRLRDLSGRPVGLSDHTVGLAAACASLALGQPRSRSTSRGPATPRGLTTRCPCRCRRRRSSSTHSACSRSA